LAQSDDELVRRTRRGDREAFSQLVDRYEKSALAVAHSILRSWHDAADAVQDAFVRAFQHLNRLWQPRKFGAWFLRIVRRQALWNLRRRVAQTRHVVCIGPDEKQDPRRAAEISEEVLAVIARLPAQECVVVSLRHLDDLPVQEIAQITRRPVGTVTKQLSRAYSRMRPLLADWR
jgi:RNA polymerase sigma-70 factor, ECF subfamily